MPSLHKLRQGNPIATVRLDAGRHAGALRTGRFIWPRSVEGRGRHPHRHCGRCSPAATGWHPCSPADHFWAAPSTTGAPPSVAGCSATSCHCTTPCVWPVAPGLPLTLVALYYAGRELHGDEHAAAAPMLLAGSAGLLLHARDAAADAGCPRRLGRNHRRRRLDGTQAVGRRPVLRPRPGRLPARRRHRPPPCRCWRSHLSPGISPASAHRPRRPCCSASPPGHPARCPLAAGARPMASRPSRCLAAHQTHAAGTPFSFAGLVRFSSLLPTFAFPALPLALWAPLARMAAAKTGEPSGATAATDPLFLTLLLLAWAYRPGKSALLLLPPLALLAAPGACEFAPRHGQRLRLVRHEPVQPAGGARLVSLVGHGTGFPTATGATGGGITPGLRR